MAIEAPQPTFIETLYARLHAPARRILLLRGSLALAFGVLALPWRGMTLGVLLGLFSAWMLISGAGALAVALRHRRSVPGWRLIALLGSVSLFVGVASLFDPGPTLGTLVLLVSVNALATGALDVAFSLIRPRPPGSRRLLLFAGLGAIASGGLGLAYQDVATPFASWAVGGYAILHGMFLLLHAFERPATFASD